MRGIESVAISILIETGEFKLPINVIHVAEKMHCKVIPYAEAKEFIELAQLKEYCKTHHSVSLASGDGYIILYSGNISFEKKLFVIAHELGHIHMHVQEAGLVFGESVDPVEQNRQEEEANVFARALLAPVAVLYKSGIYTPEQIERVTRLGKEEAQKVAGKIASMKALKEGDIITAKLCEQFKGFIISCKHARWNNWKEKWLPTGILLTAGIILILLASTIPLIIKNRSDMHTNISSASFSNYELPTTSTDIPVVIPVIPESISSETTTEEPIAVDSATTSDISNIPDGQIVYWLDGGDVYHLDRNCQHIRTKKDSLVRSGCIEESGKARACKDCGQHTHPIESVNGVEID